jgi:hypothetical protein
LGQAIGVDGVIINPDLPSGHVTFCDDIRHEVSGKMTLVGVYQGQILVNGDLPAIIPQICAVITLRLSPPSKPLRPIIKIFRSDQDEPLFSLETEISAAPSVPTIVPLPGADPDGVNFLQMGITAQIQGFAISEPCTLKVRAFIGDDEIRLGTLQILVGPQQPAGEASAT